jgi:hypothetical protein
MNLETLLVDPEDPSVPEYRCVDDTISAVKHRRKSLYWNAYLRSSLDSNQTEVDWSLVDEIGLAMKLGLTVSFVESHRGNGIVNVYISHADEAWRVKAHAEIRARVPLSSWSDEWESFQSYLLGYTKAETDAYLEYMHWGRLGWYGVTVYVAANRQQAEALSGGGLRCFVADALSSGLRAYLVRGNKVLRRDAADRLADGGTLFRAALSSITTQELFGSAIQASEHVVETMLVNEHMKRLNEGLLAPLQRLTTTGWLVPTPEI